MIRAVRGVVCRSIVAGALAGAAGTTALYAVTYLDQATRGRPSSVLPERAAAKLAGAAGLDLGEGERERNRGQGLGALLGIATGVGLGAAYGALRLGVRDVAVPVGGVCVATASVIAGSAPLVALGLTDPRTWGLAGWLSDLIPHLVFGLVTAYTFQVAAGGRWERAPR
ncbi:hypothetical protein [Sphaerisporangium corydalis]|uniref:DUF1440 domain-containing protein n=1 Tax=Sphaerisporangium corydalis TaxID=1441875 RepID=A0ABV9EM62_9ACTN|nr:hypothetical protein [Sphaerisporangium corydalis]